MRFIVATLSLLALNCGTPECPPIGDLKLSASFTIEEQALALEVFEELFRQVPEAERTITVTGDLESNVRPARETDDCENRLGSWNPQYDDSGYIVMCDRTLATFSHILMHELVHAVTQSTDHVDDNGSIMRKRYSEDGNTGLQLSDLDLELIQLHL